MWGILTALLSGALMRHHDPFHDSDGALHRKQRVHDERSGDRKYRWSDGWYSGCIIHSSCLLRDHER